MKKSNQRLETLVTKRTKELKEKNEKLKRLSQIDGLTGVANRKGLSSGDVGNVQNSVSKFLIPISPQAPAEVKVRSENGPPNSHVGRFDFLLERVVGTILSRYKYTYQILNSLSSLPSKNIASWEIVSDQF